MEKEEKEKTRNEKLGEYFLNLSNTVLGSTVLGTLAIFLVNQELETTRAAILLIIIGVLAVIALAAVGDHYLKR